MSDEITGRTFDIQRCSVHDGPGIRTTVFLKGCPLSCAWCHNPEGIDPKLEIGYRPERCIGCGACLSACKRGGHVVDDTARHLFVRGKCGGCGACAAACPTDALEALGREVTADEVVATVMRDRPFYGDTGGVTLSGGEPFAQPAFCRALLTTLRADGVHCCVETSGFWRWDAVADLIPLVDLFLYDWKETDPVKHREFCGTDNALIRENLHRIDATGKPIVLRCPIIQGFNAREDHFAGIAELAKGLERVRGVEVLAYHRLGTGKTTALGGKVSGLLPEREPKPALVEQWREMLRGMGVEVIEEG